jgi:hypothetical protein
LYHDRSDAIEQVSICHPNQSASADSPFATSLSWWKETTKTKFQPALAGLRSLQTSLWLKPLPKPAKAG